MSDLIGNPKDRISRDAAQMFHWNFFFKSEESMAVKQQLN